MKNKKLIKVLKGMLTSLKIFINEKFKLLCSLMFCIVCISAIVNQEYANKTTWIIVIVSAFILFTFISYIHEELFNVESKSDFPVLSKRLTKKDSKIIYVDKEDWQKAVLYLSTIEDYLQRKGML